MQKILKAVAVIFFLLKKAPHVTVADMRNVFVLFELEQNSDIWSAANGDSLLELVNNLMPFFDDCVTHVVVYSMI